MTFYKLEEQKNLFDGYSKTFSVAGKKLLLIQQKGFLYLIENKCGHFGVPLESGEILDKSIICSQHGIEFDLKTGKVLNNTWDDCDNINTFDVTIRDEDIGIELS